ncbi:MAG: chromosomal replication initiator protein DnaA, partial [Bacteroidia bacterium]|nr:chromosomal replication initiator protein DnaA [Bacteroidia bacterium]
LEGAMISILAHSSFTRKEIDLELARSILKNFVKNVSRELSIETIMQEVSSYYKVSLELLKDKTRKREIVQARQIAMYFAKNMTKASLKTIGAYFGGRDHSTVIHAITTVEDLSSIDKEYRGQVDDIRKRLQQLIH